MPHHLPSVMRWLTLLSVALLATGCAYNDAAYYGNANYAYGTYPAPAVYSVPYAPATVYYQQNHVYYPPQPYYRPARPYRPSYNNRPPVVRPPPPSWNNPHHGRPGYRPPVVQTPSKPPRLDRPFQSQERPNHNSRPWLTPSNNQGSTTLRPRQNHAR